MKKTDEVIPQQGPGPAFPALGGLSRPRACISVAARPRVATRACPRPFT